MEYTPKEYSNIVELAYSDIDSFSGKAIVRRLHIRECKSDKKYLYIYLEELRFPFVIDMMRRMRFGTEEITPIEYLQRVIEQGDMIDAVVQPLQEDGYPIAIYWIHIEYVGNRGEAGNFSKKDDGLFALRTKSGEKAERIVTKALQDCGHSFPEYLQVSPGYFQIRYAEKKARKPDRICQKCGMTIEIKKRNKDERFRVSHSTKRPFDSENAITDWHAFVFPDMKPRFVPNRLISEAVSKGEVVLGKDRYDSWADVLNVIPVEPPKCE